ncbi:MAG: flagellar hook-basal body complex protein FliE [Oscillospiraceae bacterium]|jgi:flagellar hook-basal body complex protein FliE|nr:flagellar hook-basal body complex protein FliE [Oscillospiraceae bacterium]
MYIVPITPMKFGAFMGDEEPIKQGVQSAPFADVLKNAVENLKETQIQSQQDNYDLAMGNTDNLAAIMINSAKADAAVTMTVQLTSRAVNAYKEIMQMQI